MRITRGTSRRVYLSAPRRRSAPFGRCATSSRTSVPSCPLSHGPSHDFISVRLRKQQFVVPLGVRVILRTRVSFCARVARPLLPPRSRTPYSTEAHFRHSLPGLKARYPTRTNAECYSCGSNASSTMEEWPVIQEFLRSRLMLSQKRRGLRKTKEGTVWFPLLVEDRLSVGYRRYLCAANLRRRNPSRPRPEPKRAKLAGSGTGVWAERSIVRLSLPTAPPTSKITNCSVTE